MRLQITKEMLELEKIFEPYLKRKNNKNYIPNDAPQEVKKAYQEWNKIWDTMKQEYYDLNYC